MLYFKCPCSSKWLWEKLLTFGACNKAQTFFNVIFDAWKIEEIVLFGSSTLSRKQNQFLRKLENIIWSIHNIDWWKLELMKSGTLKIWISKSGIKTSLFAAIFLPDLWHKSDVLFIFLAFHTVIISYFGQLTRLTDK